VVRSAWLFGTGGGNFVETMLRLAADHGEVLVVRDQVGSPTYTWHLAYGIVRLIEGVEFGIHHMAAAGACSWYEFAREIFEQAKVECKVMSATTDMLGRPAPRPAYSALASQREHAIELPPWQDGLAAYLSQRRAETEAAA
jgi:dTDP-4-dehydrorhamnose reductase